MSQQDSYITMGTDPVPRLVAQFSLPAITSVLVMALYYIVDGMFIGHYVGPDGLAAITVLFPLFVIVGALSSLVGAGSSAMVSRHLGAGNPQQAQIVFDTSFIFGTTLSLSFILLAYWNLDAILFWSGSTVELLPLSRQYSFYILPVVGFSILLRAMALHISAQGFPRVAMFSVVSGSCVNIVLDWFFIAVLKLGITGAALASLMSQCVSLLWVFCFILGRQSLLRLSIRPCFDLRSFKEMTATGLSPFIMSSSFAVVSWAFNRILGALGGTLALSTINIFFSLDAMGFMPVSGMAEGIIPLIGYNYGAGLHHRLKDITRWSFGAGLLWFIIVSLLSWFFPQPFVKIFTSDEALIAMASRAMQLGHLATPFAVFSLIGASILQGLGKARLSLTLSLLRQAFYAPMLWFLPSLLGINGVWLSLPCVETFGGLLALVLLWPEMRRWRDAATAKELS